MCRLSLMPLLVTASVAAAADEPRNVSKVIDPGRLPLRVHVFEDFETEIEKRWWMRGTPETDDLAPSLSASVPNTRALRAAETKDFDDLMGDLSRTYKAVIFNPVPGPPMGPRTRLFFRYKLAGTDTLRVQIYSLTNEYHRHLTLTGLKPGEWQQAAVDMTDARRPDGSGGPLAEDERIDDIQFYIDPAADLIIDDIILYEAAPDDETRPFPRRVIFTAWFDTGEQGKEWPGTFKIVPHEKPRTWDLAKSVEDPVFRVQLITVGVRGPRQPSETTRLRFQYRYTGEHVAFGVHLTTLTDLVPGEVRPAIGKWSEAEVEYCFKARSRNWRFSEIDFFPVGATELLVDDLLLYEPGDAEHSAAP